MQDFGASPAALRLLTSASNVALANPEEQVFNAMIEGWRNQQLSRGLREQTIRNRTATVSRFRDFVDKPPWRWTVADVDEFTAESGGRTRTLSTMRANHGSIRGFCNYLTNPLYDWMEICDREFGEVPSQVCLPWNTVAHRFEFEGTGNAARSRTTRSSACSTPPTLASSCSWRRAGRALSGRCVTHNC